MTQKPLLWLEVDAHAVRMRCATGLAWLQVGLFHVHI
jgi:hypothetical protein